MLQDSCDSEISNFNLSVLIHEYILSFQISMKNFPVVDVFNSQGHLNKPVDDLVLCVTYFAYFLLVADLGVEISSISVIHHDTEATFVHEGLLVSDNVRVSQRFQNMNFIYRIFSLFPVHSGDIDDLKC